jgi:hypothetical protein
MSASQPLFYCSTEGVRDTTPCHCLTHRDCVLIMIISVYSNCLLVSLNTRMSNHEDGGGWSRHQEPPPVLIGLRTRPEQVAVAAITERSEEGFIKTSAV